MKASEFNKILLTKKLSIATAESVTAGLLSSSITSASGASAVLKGGVVTYAEQTKIDLLGVSLKTLHKFSAESAETTNEMALGLSKLGFDASIYVAITGVASLPVNDYKIINPVGQIFVSVLYEDKLHSFQEVLKPDSIEDTRNQIREKAVIFTFDKITALIRSLK